MEAWTAALEFGSVGILALMVVEFGKRFFPRLFVSDMNVWNSVFVAVVINSVYSFSVGADVWAAIPAGAAVGFAVSGAYRGVSLSAKRNSLDMSEQAVDLQTIVKANSVEEDDDRHEDGSKKIKGFGG